MNLEVLMYLIIKCFNSRNKNFYMKEAEIWLNKNIVNFKILLILNVKLLYFSSLIITTSTNIIISRSFISFEPATLILRFTHYPLFR